MKLSNKDAWCIILLTAIQLGYSVSFGSQELQDYLDGKKPIPPYYIPVLESESRHCVVRINLDGRTEEANRIADTIA